MGVVPVIGYWQEEEKELLHELHTSSKGLSDAEAQKRLRKYGKNVFAHHVRKSAIVEFLLKFKNPLVIILLCASLISAFLGEVSNFIIITIIIVMSVLIDSIQERHAGNAVEALQRKVSVTATVMRSRSKKEVPLADVVIGDVVLLSAGDIIPADARIIESQELLVDQSALTGESYPQEKQPGVVLKPHAEYAELTNTVFMGTNVQSGSGMAVVTRTGASTELGKIADDIQIQRPETDFEKGIKSFGYLLMKVSLVLTLFVFFVNALLRHTVLDSFLFALALAVGLTPELLPIVVTINFARGALRMSEKRVIVKYLPAIQSFGSMNVCCMDKTGTLTENKIKLERYEDASGKESTHTLLLGYVNALFQAGLKSPLEEAVLKHGEVSAHGYKKIQEIPFDFFRRRLSVIASQGEERVLITKGAPEQVISVCSMTHAKKMAALDRYRALSKEGFRVLAVATRSVSQKAGYSAEDEDHMVYEGLMAFYDPPKRSAKKALADLAHQGVEIKIVTGDSDVVTKHVCDELALPVKGVVLGSAIDHLTDHALSIMIEKTTIFARVNPTQKQRIISLLKRRGNVVGYIGDGVNDAPSLRAADIGISVNNAVDIAKESADVILLKKDLRVLLDGVREGRKTFGNIMKYIMMGTSSNFGNMVSMASASLFLPFLPMLPVQILLNNLLYDFSELAVPSDEVDDEYMKSPKKWDTTFIKRFMLVFGPISSLFDFATFGLLIFIFHAGAQLFQTGWFVESLVTQSLIIFSIRTRKVPFFRSKAGKLISIASFGVAIFALLLPYAPFASVFSFTPLPPLFIVLLVLLVCAYIAIVESAKFMLYRKIVVQYK